MKVARVTNRGSPPSFMNGDIKKPTSDDKIQVNVLAVGITQQIRHRAAPEHPVTGCENIPFDPSTEGIVQDQTTGDLYYVLPRGARLLSERINVPKDALVKVSPNVDFIRVAGLLGPWLTGLALLSNCQGRKILIIGVTTCNGRVAAVLARCFKASAVIGLSDDNDALMTVPGLTIRTHITDPVRLPNFKGIDVVLDFIGGETGIQVLTQINNVPSSGLSIPRVKELIYSPAWGPCGGDPFVLDTTMAAVKDIRVLDPALALWNLTSLKMRNKLQFGLHLMESLEQTPFEIVSKSMADIESVWDEEDFKSARKMLVLLPWKPEEKSGQ
ncbi:putative NADPH-dependent quinone reductase tdiC [Penicillium rolfsii]|nr:putative NADPH-dependent quinone reductase tdiC [Penicillium rolfsii]